MEIDFIWLEVNDIKRSLEFYCEQLGFNATEGDIEAEPPIVTVRAGKLKLMLAQEYKPMITRGRGINLFLRVGDVDEYYYKLKSRGLNVAPPVDEGWGGRFITLQDPDGYRLFFFTWVNESEWPTFINQNSF
jgi:predicted enzyme related to lactoylglutathione lyase